MGSDGEREVLKSHAEPVAAGSLGGDVVVTAAQILHEGMTGGEDPRGAVTLQSPHRPQPGLQPPVICLDRIVGVLLNGVQRGGDQLIEHPRVGRGAVGRDLGRNGAGAERPGEEAPRCSQVTPDRQQDLNDLAMLIDGPVQVSPFAGHLQVCLVDEPQVARGVPARPGRLNELLVNRCTHL